MPGANVGGCDRIAPSWQPAVRARWRVDAPRRHGIWRLLHKALAGADCKMCRQVIWMSWPRRCKPDADERERGPDVLEWTSERAWCWRMRPISCPCSPGGQTYPPPGHHGVSEPKEPAHAF